MAYSVHGDQAIRTMEEPISLCMNNHRGVYTVIPCSCSFKSELINKMRLMNLPEFWNLFSKHIFLKEEFLCKMFRMWTKSACKRGHTNRHALCMFGRAPRSPNRQGTFVKFINDLYKGRQGHRCSCEAWDSRRQANMSDRCPCAACQACAHVQQVQHAQI